MQKGRIARAAGFCLTLAFASGCAGSSPVRDFCLLYIPVTTAAADTEATRAQADGNNAVWLELCGERE